MARSRKVKLFMSTCVPCFTYGLEALTLTDRQLKKIDGHFYPFLRRAIGIKASYYSIIIYHKILEYIVVYCSILKYSII